VIASCAEWPSVVTRTAEADNGTEVSVSFDNLGKTEDLELAEIAKPAPSWLRTVQTLTNLQCQEIYHVATP